MNAPLPGTLRAKDVPGTGPDLLKDAVRLLEQPVGQGEAQSAGRPEIDAELDLRRRLDRELGGFGAFQQAVDVIRAAPVALADVGPVAHQAAGLDVLNLGEERGQLLRRE